MPTEQGANSIASNIGLGFLQTGEVLPRHQK